MASADPPYRLSRKETRSVGAGAPRTVYEQSFRSDVWARGSPYDSEPRFGGANADNGDDKLALARHAYASAVSAHTMAQVTGAPPHVEVLLAEEGSTSSMIIGGKARVRVPNAAIDTLPANKTWIYIVEPIASVATMACVGGFSLDAIAKKARRLPAVHEFFRVRLDPTGFFDTHTLERESSLPPVPPAMASPHNSLIVSGGISAPPSPEAPTSSPLLDYCGTRPPEATLQRLRDFVSPYVAPEHLIERRYEALQNVGRFAHDNEEIGAIGASGTVKQVFEASSIALFQGLRDDDVHLQHCADVVSYWMIREHIIDVLPRDSPVWKWFVEHETQFVALRTSLTHAEANNVAGLLEPVAETFGMVRDPGARTYSTDIISALGAGIDLSARGGAGIVRTDAATHRVTLTEEYVAARVMPLWIKKAVLGEIPGPPTAANDALEENMGGARKLAGEAVRKAVEWIVGDRLDAVQRGQAGLHLPTASADHGALPDIEDLGAAKALFAPCAFVLEEKLRATGHLKFGERLAHTSFLLDLNYPSEAVEKHLRKHFTTTGGTSDGEFSAKYAGAVHRNERGKWEGGVRTVPYGMSCRRIVARTDIIGDNRANADLRLGCPFQRNEPRADLVALLGRMGVDDSERAGAIAYTARVEGNCQKACADTFAAKFGRLPSGTWRPRAPRTYYQEGRAIVVEALAD